MRRLLALGAAALLLAGCASRASRDDDVPAQPSPAAPATTELRLPPDPEPVAAEPCPYLDTGEVARANGQQVGEVRTSADTPHPTCFFYRPDGEVQMTVRVYVGEPDVAKALVDRAAPIATSNPTEQPPGWKGGYESRDDGAVYAVAKGGQAVIVTTNQQQSVKARTVATQAIAELGI